MASHAAPSAAAAVAGEAGPSSNPLSAAIASEVLESRPQAGPLPRKRGEIGFQEGMDVEPGGDSSDNSFPLPARHPADREPDLEAGQPSNDDPPPPTIPAAPSSPVESSSDASSMHKPAKRPGFLLSWLEPLRRTKIGGVPLTTVLRLSLQLVLLAGTIAVWVVLTMRIAHDHNDDGSDGQQESSDIGGNSAAPIFVHVLFAILTLAQLLLLERTIFFVRAQRYAHIHHGASLPSHSRSRGGSPSNAGGTGGGASVPMAFAPWNRPPLPTYAAALAQSGVGTGDVEDNIIAIPPPPAYGNTRGSTLLLAGFMRNSLRAVIGSDQNGTQRASSRLTSRSYPDRPLSYRSHDEEWEQRCDAERALRLAETLERLEDNSSSSAAANMSRSSSGGRRGSR